MLEKLLRRWRKPQQLPGPKERAEYTEEPTDEELIERASKHLTAKATACHRQVLNAYASWGLDVGPVSVLIVPPGMITTLAAALEKKGELPRKNSRDAVGMYDGRDDVILLDGGHVFDNDEFEVRRVIGHEYGHRIYGKFMTGVRTREFFRRRGTPIAELSTTSEAEYEGAHIVQRSADALMARIREERTRPLTRNDRRRMEFDNYFEERFVESLAAFMNNHTTACSTSIRKASEEST